MGKCLLLLGGAMQQVIALKRAKKMGCRTILCDRDENNLGRFFADVFYLESICDKKAILEIAKKEKVDGVICYAADPGVVTASYVSNKLNLPTNPYESIEILSNKDLFRNFLKENGFNTPLAKGYSSIKEALNEIDSFKLPVMVKPVDSSGSRGVSKIKNINNLKEKIENALFYSQKKRFIIEEYVEMVGRQISGDAIAIDGKLKVMCLGKHYFNENGGNKYIPISTAFPSGLKKGLREKIKKEVQRLISKLNIKSTMFNLEIRIDEKENIYLIEAAPRNGGNFIPQIVGYAMDLDLVEIALKIALGEKVVIKNKDKITGYWSYIVISSKKEGKFDKVVIRKDIQKNIVEKNLKFKKGDLVNKFIGGNDSIGVLIMNFESKEEMENTIKTLNDWLKVELE